MRTQILSDSKLISLYLKGDEVSLNKLINRHQYKLFSFILSKTHDKDLADDIFQETFIKVIKTLRKGGYKDEGKFLPWIIRISNNLFIDHCRKKKRESYFSGTKDFDIFDVINNKDKNIEDILITDQIHTDVKKILEELPSEQKEVLKMRYYSEMSFKDIADQTNVSINTALGRMRYALINLRKLIEKNDLSLNKT